MRDIRNLFELENEKENHFKPIKVDSFYSYNYIEYESNGDRNKTISTEEYLNEIRPHLKDIINNLKKSDTWKIQLMTVINFMSSKDTAEDRLLHSKGDNIEIIINDKADEVIEELFLLFVSRYQISLKTTRKGSAFIMFIYCITNIIKSIQLWWTICRFS